MTTYYQTPDAHVYAFTDEQMALPNIADYIPAGAEEIDEETALALANPPETPEQRRARLDAMVVSRAQGKTALITAGLWDQVVAYVDGITDPTQHALAEVALNDTQEWRRTSPFLLGAAAAIGVDANQMDSLFEQAAEIEL